MRAPSCLRAATAVFQLSFRWLGALGLLVVLLVDFGARAAEAGEEPGKSTAVTTSLTPTTGLSLRLGKNLALAAQAQIRIPDLAVAGGTGKPDTGALARLRLGAGLTEIFAIQAGYTYAWGVFPVDGAADQEHRISAGAAVGSARSADRRVSVRNVLRVELRTLHFGGRESGAWGVQVRPRNELRLDVSVAEWLNFSIVNEAVFEPQLRAGNWLQMRSGLVLHGRVPLGPEPTQSGRQWGLHWFVGDVFAFRPLALSRIRSGAGELETRLRDQLDAPLAAEPDGAVHMLLTFGLSAMI